VLGVQGLVLVQLLGDFCVDTTAGTASELVLSPAAGMTVTIEEEEEWNQLADEDEDEAEMHKDEVLNELNKKHLNLFTDNSLIIFFSCAR